jgi:hypothetical protein
MDIYRRNRELTLGVLLSEPVRSYRSLFRWHQPETRVPPLVSMS